MKRYDVVIVGEGLAGLQCAHLLGKQGARVLLADRNLFTGSAGVPPAVSAKCEQGIRT